MSVQFNHLLGQLLSVRSRVAYTAAYNPQLSKGNDGSSRTNSNSNRRATSIIVNMQGASTTFYVLLGLLMLDALFEMSFIAATVAFLHTRAGGSFEIWGYSDPFELHGKPLHLLLNQGHTSNGAAGTALILVGIGGFLTFPFLRRDLRTGQMTTYSRVILPTWLVFAFLSTVLTFVALVWTQKVTSDHVGQTINTTVASQLHNQPYPNQVPYPLDTWTPENWFRAVLDLNIVAPSDRSLISTKYNVIKGWRWNLCPLFVLGAVVFGLGLVEARRLRHESISIRQEHGEAGIMAQIKQSDDESAEEQQPQQFHQYYQHHPRQQPYQPLRQHEPAKPVSAAQIARKPVGRL